MGFEARDWADGGIGRRETNAKIEQNGGSSFSNRRSADERDFLVHLQFVPGFGGKAVVLDAKGRAG